MPINNLSLPTTSVWDPSVLEDIEINSPEFKELLIRLYQNINNIALTVNLKDSGYYDTSEFINAQRFFPNPLLTSSSTTTPTYRDVIRMVINFGALPNTATKTVAHGITITPSTTFTRIYATASDTTNDEYIPIPYASAAGGNQIELFIDAANVNIVTTSNRSSFNVTYVILEYLQT